MAVSLSEVESAARCVLYPDTTVCGLGSASCRLVIREPAPHVYLSTGEPITEEDPSAV